MQQLLLTNVDDAVLQRLEARARLHGRAAADEAKIIIEEAVRGASPLAWASVDAIYQRLAASGRSFADSADSLREDRDR